VSSPSLTRLLARAAVASAVGCSLLGLAAPAALADGDPASDYLITQPTFLSPFDGKISKDKAARLTGLLADAKKQGFPLKVAVIVTPYDLGAVPVLFGKPQRYASFLGQELIYFSKQQLLVVMPNGYGIFKAKKLPAADRKLIASLPPPRGKDGDSLVTAASDAVVALAARRGITLKASSGSRVSSANRDRALIAGAVLVVGLLLLGLHLVRRRRRVAAP